MEYDYNPEEAFVTTLATFTLFGLWPSVVKHPMLRLSKLSIISIKESCDKVFFCIQSIIKMLKIYLVCNETNLVIKQIFENQVFFSRGINS